MKRTRKALISLLLVVLFVAAMLPLSASAVFSAPQRSNQKLTVDGEKISCEKYNIDGSNYFKLRDIAYLLNGTGSQFSVGWNAKEKVVEIWTGKPYESTGSELVIGADQSATAKKSSQTILINGVKRSNLTVYNIGGSDGYNYFKLRDLGEALNFAVGYDAVSNTAQVTSYELRDYNSICWVSNVDDLMEFVANNTIIYLAPGTYNLTQWLESIIEDAHYDYNLIQRTYPLLDAENMDYNQEIQVQDVGNFALVGAGAGKTEIVVEPRYANVLCFEDCQNITLHGITFGHTPEQGYCSGAVLNFRNCDDVELCGLDLYGCGTYGIEANGLSYLTMRNSTIRDCSYGALYLSNCYALDFIGCDIRNNKNLDTLSLYCTGGLWFEDCAFTGNEFDFVDGCGFLDTNPDAGEMFGTVATFVDCTLGSREYESLLNCGYLDELVELVNPRLVS